MSVGSVTGSTTTTTAASTTKNSLGKNDFLKLLVTQLQNQDPLDPTDTSQFMNEMCQLSSVEALTNMEDSINSMTSSTVKTNQVQWLSLVGTKACVGSSTVSKGDEVVLTPTGDYDKITLTLKTSDGDTKEVTFKPGDSLTYTYDGNSKATASVSATKNGKAATCSVKVYSMVAGVQLGDGNAMVELASGGTYSTEKVTGIRE